MNANPQNARLSDRDALELYRSASLHELGAWATDACRRKHPEPFRTYVVDRNVNYGNVCQARCDFCAFSADAGEKTAWLASTEQILGEVQELLDIGGNQVLLQGGLHPHLPFEWYVNLLRDIKRTFPNVHLHAFSPPEIFFMHRQFGLGIGDVLARLQEAGLSSIPGGGAEILVDRVRQSVSPKKCTRDEWLEVMRQAHRLGMRTSATMVFGHIETDAERIEHLRVLRDLQDESLSHGRGSFTAFIGWTFQSGNTKLGARPQWDPSSGVPFDGQCLRPSGAHEYLRTLALARLYLDNFDNIQSSWVTQGPKIGQLGLFWGANDLGSVMMVEKVVASAGTSFKLSEEQLRHLISDAGYRPMRRDFLYNVLA